MTDTTPPISPEFKQYVHSLVEKSDVRIQSVTWEEKKYWIKRPEHPQGKDKWLKRHPQALFQHEIDAIAHMNKLQAPAAKMVLHGDNFLVLEDVGTTLNQILAQKERSISSKSIIIKQAASALAQLHSLDIIHGRPAIRDIAYDGNHIHFIDFEAQLNLKRLEYNKTRDLLIFIHDLCRNEKYIPHALVLEAIAQYREMKGEEMWQKALGYVGRFKWLYYFLQLFRPIAHSDLIALYKVFETVASLKSIPR